MSDNNLRKQLIKLAYENKELRPHLLPVLKQAGEDWLEQKVKNPDTGNMVKVKTLQSKDKDTKAYKMYQQIAELQKKKHESMSKDDIKKVFEDSPSKYFDQHLIKGISKKKVSDTLKGTGWKPRGKGRYNKKRGVLSILLDPENSRHLPMWLSLSAGHYTKDDGRASLYFEATPRSWTHQDIIILSGDAETDTEEMLKNIKENLEFLNEEVYLWEKNK
jgi:hypothetical protein